MNRINKGLNWMKTGNHSAKKSYQKESRGVSVFVRQIKPINNPKAYFSPLCYSEIFWARF